MMNVKLSKNELRFRIHHDDLKLLLSGQDVLLEMAILPDHPLCFRLCATDKLDKNLQLISSESTLKLLVLKQSLLALQQHLPSKDGIQENVLDCKGKTLKLIIEVDIKKR